MMVATAAALAVRSRPSHGVPPAAGHVEAATGESTAARAAAPSRKLAPSAVVFIDDLIATQVQSTLDLLLGMATHVRLGPETEFRIDRFVVNAGGVLVLDRGAMLYDHEPKDTGDAVTVRTPFGLLAVRGTRFFAGPTKGEFSVFVERGSVMVTGINTFVTLTSGQGTGIAAPGGEPSSPITWGKPRIAEAMGRVGLS
jgi:ferric-dicitrate binding protein FerR (iron transport regulator)